MTSHRSNSRRQPTPIRPREGRGDWSRSSDRDHGININFLWREAGVALQIDYEGQTPKERMMNAFNDEKLRADGLVVIRVPEADIRDDPEQVIDRVKQVFDERGLQFQV